MRYPNPLAEDRDPPPPLHTVEPDPWPLHHLELCTPRQTLRPDDDDGLRELAILAARGIHPPEEMPFVSPWTDQEPADLVRGTMQHHWAQRAALAPDNWSVHFLVRHAGRVLGTQNLAARDFAITQEVSTGSWLGRAHQRQGHGTEMRAAVLLFAFDHLGATTATSGAFTDNPASAAVSEALGYRRDGESTHVRRGRRVTAVRFRLDAGQLVRPEWTLQVTGFDAACRALLGARITDHGSLR